MSYYRRIKPRRRVSVNNTPSPQPSVPNKQNDIAFQPCCEDCYQLENIKNKQHEDMMKTQETLDEMKYLKDWLNKDVEKARQRIRYLEQGDEGGQNLDSEEARIQCLEIQAKSEKAETLKVLSEQDERLSELETREGICQNLTDELQRENQCLFEELEELMLIEREQTKDLRINKEIIEELDQRIERLGKDNEDLTYRVDTSPLQRDNEVIDWSMNIGDQIYKRLAEDDEKLENKVDTSQPRKCSTLVDWSMNNGYQITKRLVEDNEKLQQKVDTTQPQRSSKVVDWSKNNEDYIMGLFQDVWKLTA